MEINVTVKQTSNYFSPLRYPGGKASLSTYLGSLIEASEIRNCIYVEPYAGGAGAALELLFLERVEKIIINDFDKAIYSIWYCIIHELDAFINKILETDLTLHEWKKQKEIYSSKPGSLLDLGFAAFFLNRTNRSGIINGGPIGGMNQAGKYKVDARFNKERIIKRLRKISYYKNRIEIRNQDGVDLIQDVKSPHTFFYIDPPYYVKGRDLYLNHYRYEDHKKLSSFLMSNQDFFWVLTYDNVPEIRDLYDKTKRIIDFSLNYFAGVAKKGNELMIFSDSLILPNPSESSQISLFENND